jgi:hypothetical protein
MLWVFSSRRILITFCENIAIFSRTNVTIHFLNMWTRSIFESKTPFFRQIFRQKYFEYRSQILTTGMKTFERCQRAHRLLALNFEFWSVSVFRRNNYFISSAPELKVEFKFRKLVFFREVGLRVGQLFTTPFCSSRVQHLHHPLTSVRVKKKEEKERFRF